METLDITPRREITPLTSILVPLDGSDASKQAIPYAAAFHVDRLGLLRVLGGEAPGSEGGPLDFFASWRRDRIDEVDADLRHLVTENEDSAGTVDFEVRYGDPAEQIIAASAEFDLVAMTSRGRGAVERSVFGSVADRVVRYGTRPTLVAHVGDAPAPPAFPARIVVPLDGSAHAERALPLATRIAAMLDVSLHLVRAVGMDEILATVRRHRKGEPFHPSDESDTDPYEVAREASEGEAHAYLDRVASALSGAGYQATTEMRGGTPAFELAWATSAEDLMVMASRGQGGSKRWRIGSVAEKVIREAKSPVAIVPVQADADA